MYLLHINTPQQEPVPAGTPGAYDQFRAFNNTYTGVSASIGATYQLPGHQYVKLNLAKSYRAPSINELTSNELSPGSTLCPAMDLYRQTQAERSAPFSS